MEMLEPWDPLDHPARIEVRRQESEDSDAEGGLGNVTRVVLRPPGHSGKAKRGHLSFDASFESGNLGRVDFISEFEYDLFIRPDTCNPRFRLWFNFVVDNVRADQRVVFNIVNLSKTKTLFAQGLTPLVKTSSRPKWQRLGGKHVYFHKSPEHRHHHVLSFAFLFDREQDVYQFALTFPYSYARLNAHLANLLLRPHVATHTLAHSLQGRKVEVVTLGSPALSGGRRPKLVVVMARSHPGESPASFVAQGLMDFLASAHPLAVLLREHVVLKVIPMLNPDGVFLGNHRTSAMGQDLNRSWNQVSPWTHPVLHALKAYLAQLDTAKALELDMVLDLHAHTSLLGAFITGNSYDDVYRFERHILFPKLLAHQAEDFAPAFTMYNRDPAKLGTARRHLCELLRSTVNIYTLEVSILGYSTPDGLTVAYNEDSYFRLGRNVVRTLVEYYRVTGLILPTAFPTTAPAQLEDGPKKKGLRRSMSRPSPKPEDFDKEGGNGKVGQLRRAVSQDSASSNSPLPTRKAGQISALADGDGHRETDRPTKKTTYTTFDFSPIQGAEGAECHGGGRRRTEGRKIGGGGVVGRKRGRRGGSEWPGRPPHPPSLTIIDFNVFLRAALLGNRRLAPATARDEQRAQRRRRRVRKRQARLLRGSVTDCSAWEDTSGSEWESRRSAPSSPVHALSQEKLRLCPRPAKAPSWRSTPRPGTDIR